MTWQAVAVLATLAVLLVLFVLRILWHIGSLLRDMAACHDAAATVALHDAGLLHDATKRAGQ